MNVDPAALARRAAQRDRHAVARLISLLEDRRLSRRGDQEVALRALAEIDAPRGGVIGFTGTPGSGKSTLLARLTEVLLAADPSLTVAIVAVDPSSPTSGGALLGDRTRMRPVDTERLFVRSQASDTALGGLAPTTCLVCTALTRIFDLVLVETVGIGQSEADIRHLASYVYLVVGPLGGDELQFLKAGIIEIPDSFVVSKWDEPSAERTFLQVQASLWLARPFDAEELPVLRTSAKNGFGVDELVDDVRSRLAGRAADRDALHATRHFLRRWVVDEWGRAGLRHLDSLGGAEALLASEADLWTAQDTFERSLRSTLQPG